MISPPGVHRGGAAGGVPGGGRPSSGSRNNA